MGESGLFLASNGPSPGRSASFRSLPRCLSSLFLAGNQPLVVDFDQVPERSNRFFMCAPRRSSPRPAVALGLPLAA
jgi:hypothetical protein